MVTGGFWVGILLGLAGTSFILQARGLARPWHGVRVDAIANYANLISIALAVASGAAFLTWQSRALKRLAEVHQPGGDALPSLRVIWWFVPFANLITPFRQIDALYRQFASIPTSWLTRAWWASFLAMSVLRKLTEKSEDFALAVVAVTATLVSAALAVRIVLEIQRGIEAHGTANPSPALAKPAGLLAILGMPLRGVLAASALTTAGAASVLVAFGPEIDPGPHIRTGTLSFVSDWVNVTGLRWTFSKQQEAGAPLEYRLRVESRAQLVKDPPEGVRGVPVLVEYELLDEHGGALDSMTSNFTLAPDKSLVPLIQEAQFPPGKAKLIADVRLNVVLDESRVLDCKLGMRPCPRGFLCEPWGGCSVDARDDDVAALHVKGRRTCVDAGIALGAECLAALHNHYAQPWGNGGRAFANTLCSLLGQDRADACEEQLEDPRPCSGTPVAKALALSSTCNHLLDPRFSKLLDGKGILTGPNRAEICRTAIGEMPTVHAQVCNRPIPTGRP